MRTASLDFVVAPSSAATVVQSLTETPSWLQTVTDFTLGSPTFEARPDSVGGEYGYRSCSFTLRMVGTYAEIAPTMQAISRQLLAPHNWLQVTWGGTSDPMFLRTYRTAPAGMQWHQTGAYWDLPVTLTCDPFLYGVPQTIGPVTVGNDPATATPGCFYRFPAILGDAPAPLTTKMKFSTTTANPLWPLLSVAPFHPPLAPAGPLVWQAESLLVDTDTTVSADATMSGGSRAVVTFATNATLTRRLKGNPPTVPLTGTYKVLLRVERLTRTAEFSLRFGQRVDAGKFLFGDTKRLVGDGTGPLSTLVSLGEFTFPFGAETPSLAEATTTHSPYITLDISRAAGTDLRLDYFLLIPIDTAATVDTVYTTRLSEVVTETSQYGVLNSDHRPPVYNLFTGAGLMIDRYPMELPGGGFLRVVPGATNVLHAVRQTLIGGTDGTRDAGSSGPMGATVELTFTYSPRYLHLRPDGG